MANGWQTVPLGEFLTQRKEFFTIDDFSRYKRARVQSHGKGIVLRDEIDGIEIKTKKQQAARTGEFLVAEIDAKVGGFGIVPPELEGAVVSSHYFLFQIDEKKCSKDWLNWFIRHNSLEVQVKAQGSTNYAAIRPSHVLNFEIPLPPLKEQYRIVERIQSLSIQIIKAQSLREEADHEAETINISTRNQIFTELQSKVKPVRFDTFADMRLGKMLSEKSKTGVNSKPYLRNANIQWDSLNLSNVYEMDFDENEQKTFRLKAGDILVCEGGDIGKSAIWNDELAECYYQKALHRIRVDLTKTMPRFILNHIFWAAEQGHFAEMKTQTTFAHLTGVKLKSYNIFLPPLDEQRRIVAYLDSVQARLASLRRLQSQTGEELDALLPSVLDRAFKGEL